MANRIEKFNSEIIPEWNNIEEKVKDLSVKDMSTNDRDEIARLKKVVTHFSVMITGIDPDFVPMQVINNLTTPFSKIQSDLNNYNNSNNIAYIERINNEYIDTLLRDLMPYIFYKGKAGTALQKAISTYSETIQSHAKEYLDDIKENAKTANDRLKNINLILENLQKKEEKFNEYDEHLFSDDEDGLKNKFESLFNDVNDQLEEINTLHSEIFKEDGIEQKIKENLEISEDEYQKIVKLKNNSSEILDELEDFHTEIFGEKNEDGELTGGLKQELIIRKNQLDKFKKEQEERYKELNNQINSLLPRATSAGLSSAYNEMRMKFSKSSEWYGYGFYVSLLLLLVSVFISSAIINPEVFKPIIKLVLGQSDNNIVEAAQLATETKDIWENLLLLIKNLIFRLSFIIPALWLVLFVSRRKSEAQRLEQEYAHKEALAKSYESYKTQIEKLQEEEQKELLPVLMKNMIKAIALNPAKTLDKNHKGETPLDELLKDKNIFKEMKDIILSKLSGK